MKTNKILKISLLGMMMVLMAFVAQAQPVAIAGKLQPGAYEGLALTNMEKNVNIPVQIHADQTFKLTIPTLTKGFYTLGSLNLYLEPGFNLEVMPDGKTYSFSGKGAVENTTLTKSIGTKKECFYFLSPAGAFYFSGLNIKPDKMLQIIDHYKVALNKNAEGLSNTYFKGLMMGDLNSYSRDLLSSYEKSYGIDSAVMMEIEALPTSKYYTDQMDVYKVMMFYMFTAYQDWLTDAQKADLKRVRSTGFEWNNEDLYLNSPYYRSELLGQIESINGLRPKPKPKTDPEFYTNQMRIVDEKITNATVKDGLKGTLASQYLRMEKNEQRMDSMYRTFAGLKIPDYQRELINSQYRNAKVLKADPASINFAYQDVDGKIVQLKDLRGKYVYIDIWATWCGPCKTEIPYLKKIEGEYKTKNIQFVSLSVDKQADKGKWQSMVKDLELEGIQVIADKDFSSNFIQVFQIASIPRFLLIAPDGKIVSADAFRPSDPKLKEQLDKLL